MAYLFNQCVLLFSILCLPLFASYKPIAVDDLQYALANTLCWFQHELSHCTDVSSHINQILLRGISMLSGVVLDNTEIDAAFWR